MARRSRLRIEWRELPTRYRTWMALPTGQKLFWMLGKLVRVLVLYGIIATAIIWYNLPDAFGAVLDGERAVWSILPPLVADLELLALLAIILPMIVFLVVVPHRRVDEHGREVP